MRNAEPRGPSLPGLRAARGGGERDAASRRCAPRRSTSARPGSGGRGGGPTKTGADRVHALPGFPRIPRDAYIPVSRFPVYVVVVRADATDWRSAPAAWKRAGVGLVLARSC